MSCSTILDAFAYATESLDSHIYKVASQQSIWLKLIRRGTYPKGVGATRTVFGVGYIEPESEDSWTTISTQVLGGSDGACNTSYGDVEWCYYDETYSPEYIQKQGPIICARNLVYAHNVEDFISAYMEKLRIRMQRVWEQRYEHWHDTFAKKAIATTDFIGSWDETYDSHVPDGNAACPDCELTQEMLEYVAEDLILNGATNPDQGGFISWEQNGPIFPLYIGMNQSQRILRNNSGIRQDYRDAFSGAGEKSPVIARIGGAKVIGNFRHIIDPLPPRYDCSNGVLTRVWPYGADTAEAKGNCQKISTDYKDALYEGARVLSPDLFTSEIVVPQSAGLDFNPVSHMGELIWKTGAFKWDTDCVDPLEERGRHFAVFTHAPKPHVMGLGKYGWLIVYKRCIGDSVECTTCSS
jgi:hypothetical protein